MQAYICSRGWSARCARSKGPKCGCQCRGHNHGNPAARPKPQLDFVERATQVIHRDRNEQGLIVGRALGAIGGQHVEINGRTLYPGLSLSFRNHSPDGFQWGYGGSGPAQLALAILLELVDSDKALYLYQSFKWAKIANLKQGDDFAMPVSEVYAWIDQQPA